MPDLVIDLSRVALKRRRTKTVATVGLQQELAGLGERPRVALGLAIPW